MTTKKIDFNELKAVEEVAKNPNFKWKYGFFQIKDGKVIEEENHEGTWDEMEAFHQEKLKKKE